MSKRFHTLQNSLPSKEKHFHIKRGDQFEVKELFKDIAAIIKSHFSRTNNLSLLDVGCASGELSVYLKRELKTQQEVCGLDLSEEMIQNAQERFGRLGIEFVVGNAVDFKLPKSYDAITMTSVLGHFDEPFPAVENMLRHLSDRGILIISGVFNPWNIDVKMQYRLDHLSEWKGGLNQFSMSKMTRHLQHLGYECRFQEQIMPFEVYPKEYPVRSWTVDLNGKRHMMCGVQLVYNIQILIITKMR